MSVSFQEIVRFLKVGSTGYYNIDMIWIDYVYLENNQAIVSDASTHGATIETLPDLSIERGQRYAVKLTVKHIKKGKFAFKATSMTLLSEEKKEDISVAEGPSYVVILSASDSPIFTRDRPLPHTASILMIQGISSASFIGLKYMLRQVFKEHHQSNKEKLWELIFSYSFKWGPTFRYLELESIATWNFIHAHDFILDRVPTVIKTASDTEHVKKMRAIASAELTRRYAAGERDRDPKVDLPSGKCDIIETQSNEFRFESGFEAALRELKEETGLPLTELQYLGSSRSRARFVSSQFFFFQLRPNSTAKMSAKDCYVASSWTSAQHIRSYMAAVEGSPEQFGRFDSLRRVGNAEEIFDALSTISRLPSEEESRTLELLTKNMPHSRGSSLLILYCYFLSDATTRESREKS